MDEYVGMFMRFVVPEIHPRSHQPQGLFQTAYALLENGDLNGGEREQLQSLIDWFEENLPIPDDPLAQGRAVFWYRSSAHECIHRMWQLANILSSHGYAIELQTCRRFGNIRYSDAYQVAAYPHEGDAETITR